jgi:uncharacterized phage protein (TIGR02218 family)
VTTICHCWHVTRRDGTVLGFTDHDRDITFDGMTFRAEAGSEAATTVAQLGLAPGGGEIIGALSGDAVTVDDLLAGRWDGAAIETFLVDWSEPTVRARLARHVLGEVRRADSSFVAELRGAETAYNEVRGRLFETGCDAILGDARCGVDLSSPAFAAAGSVLAGDGVARLVVSGLADRPAGFFRFGRLTWTGGANLGLAAELRDHRVEPEGVTLELWRAPHFPVSAGDGFSVTAGCDKRFTTCRDKFANAARFRGFPHIPGEELLTRVARDGEPGMDGGSLFR